jgi:hypothetical protein
MPPTITRLTAHDVPAMPDLSTMFGEAFGDREGYTARRRGGATALIERLRALGTERGAWVLFVQADTAEEDAAAIALYSKLGEREEVLHFDIAVPKAMSTKR